MKFPITRECLQTLDFAKERDELREEEIHKMLAQILEQLCNEFKKSISSNFREKKFVWRRLQNIRQLNISGVNTNLDEYLPQFIENLKEVFIDCDIIIDPLKTYLIIDWS